MVNCAPLASENYKRWTTCYITWFRPCKQGFGCGWNATGQVLRGIDTVLMGHPCLHSHATLSHVHGNFNLKHTCSCQNHFVMPCLANRDVKLT